MFIILCLWNWNVVFYNLFVGRNLRTMRRSKSQDASEIPNVAKVVYSCIWSVLLTIMTIKKDATICVLKVWIRNVKKWKLELTYVLPIRCVIIGHSYGYIIDLDVAYEAYHPLYIFKLVVRASLDSERQV